MSKTDSRRRATLVLFAVAALAAPAAAQTYPNKPIRVIASSAPGGSVDVVARLLAQKLATQMGQAVVVENKAGAAGNIATEYVAKQPADGYTLLVVTTSHATNLNLYAKLGYDPVKDFAPISILSTNFLALAVPAASPATSLKDLVALGKARKDKPLSYASAGNGQANHLGMELLKTLAGFDATHVPYNGVGPAATALLGGQVDMAILSPPAAVPNAKAGKLRLLAVTGTKRVADLPDVPTVAEAGYPGYDLTGWLGLLAPAGTPQAVVDRLARESARAMNDPEVVKQLGVIAAEPVGSTPQELAALVQIEITKWAKVIKAAGVKPE
ncbi:MAG: tripartite tricarboxylate transporter substrate binding protein [Acidobacteria bacterium]|nr:tripartite tricarboxylate transporter substrate binding protein [Acidobacteriota bacterium]